MNEFSENNLQIYKGEEFIKLNFSSIIENNFKCKNYSSNLDGIEIALNEFDEFLSSNNYTFPKLNIILNELLMNAYEHGNLNISFKEKEKLIEEDKYIDFLKSQETKKHIKVCFKILKLNKKFLVLKVSDEGKGFKKQIKKEDAIFNGRGILMSEKYSDALFYNEKGNVVVFIKELDE